MLRKFRSKRFLALVTVAMLAVTGAAFAYFSSTGSGTGTASVGQANSWVVAQDAFSPTGTPAVTLYPGQGIQALTGTSANSGSGNQQLNKIVANIVAPTATHAGTNPCTAADYALSSTGTTAGTTWVLSNSNKTATLTVNQDVLAGATYHFSGLSVDMIDRHDTVAGDGSGNQDACQNATVNLTYDAS